MPKDTKVRLPLLGGDREVTLPVPGGKGALTMVLPAARKLSKASMDASVESERAEGRHVTCKSGCAACCRQLIPVSLIEARALMTIVEKMPTAKRDAIERRFAASLARIEEAGLAPKPGREPRTSLLSDVAGDVRDQWNDVNDRYLALDLACPFLERERCVVYEDRPFVCREHMVTTDPAACTTGVGARAVPRPAYLTRALAKTVEALDGIMPSSLPLLFAPEWLAARGSELGKDHDGAEALAVLVESLDWYEEAGGLDEG